MKEPVSACLPVGGLGPDSEVCWSMWRDQQQVNMFQLSVWGLVTDSQTFSGQCVGLGN